MEIKDYGKRMYEFARDIVSARRNNDTARSKQLFQDYLNLEKEFEMLEIELTEQDVIDIFVLRSLSNAVKEIMASPDLSLEGQRKGMDMTIADYAVRMLMFQIYLNEARSPLDFARIVFLIRAYAELVNAYSERTFESTAETALYESYMNVLTEENKDLIVNTLNGLTSVSVIIP